MESLGRTRLLDFDEGRHFASEPHLRIQVRRIPGTSTEQRQSLFGAYHGELLAICLKGRCSVETANTGLVLGEMDQALLVDGEPFRIVGIDIEDAVVELIWAPGPNPCRFCWEVDRKFFEGDPKR
ncbi:MAG: hypothetical protein HY953_03235 [Candidatus Rokubacteria bacterium]|nr:hypothetical protein [Candidatus Rokubacteria bacterium]